jgi:hypothetical protein
MPTDDLDRFCCHNPDCTHSGRRGAGNLSVCGRFAKAHHRLLYCQARFSEFKGTPLVNAKPPHDPVLAILPHLAAGCGVRQTARLVGVNKDTVTRLALLAGARAQAAHDELVAFCPLHSRGPVRCEVGLRRPEAEALRPGRPGR